MNKKLNYLPGLILLIVFTLSFSALSCKSRQNKTEAEKTVTETKQPKAELLEQYKSAEKVFNALPTPLEIAQIIKGSGATFDETLLNSVDNQSNYTTSKSMALNLGIYTCDLSFASMYDQTTHIVNYMSAAEKMAKGLGIMDAIDENTIEKLEQNINNRDVIMEVVSETFLNSQSYLEDDEQHAVAATIIAGGFIEGLYISTNLVDMKKFKGNKLVNTIIDQKMSVDDLLRMLETYSDNAAIQELLGPLKELKASFDKVERSKAPSQTILDPKTGVTEIKGAARSEIKPEIFLEIRNKVTEIRNVYVK
jgi:hypothetical protein